MTLLVDRIYRLKFPGSAAHVSGKTTMVALALSLVFSLYLPVAWWLRAASERAMATPAGAIEKLVRFRKRIPDGYTYISPFEWKDLGDTAESKDSPVMLYENDHPLRPVHSVHADIEKIGLGRFSNWKGLGMCFRPVTIPIPDGTAGTTGRFFRQIAWAGRLICRAWP